MREYNFLRSGLLNILFQICFLVIFYIFGRDTALDMGGSLRSVVLLGIILIPSFIWALFFYFMDRREPEPSSHILMAFVAGMTGAILGSIPLQHSLFHVQKWLYASEFLFVVGSFFVISPCVVGFLYVIFRFGFYPLREFDEPVDGMVYGAIIGGGFALIQSLDSLSKKPEFTLFVIAYTATTNILIYSGVGSIVGYIFGMAKFRHKNLNFYSLGAVISGILILGIYNIINEFIFISGFGNAFWISFVLTLVYVSTILLFSYYRMRVLTKKDYHESISVRSKFDPLTVAFLIICLLIGGVFAAQGEMGKKFKNDDLGISFYYPFKLTPFSAEFKPMTPLLLSKKAKILVSGKNITPAYSFLLKVHERSDPEHPLQLIEYVAVNEPESLIFEEIMIDGEEGNRIYYSFLEKRKTQMKKFPVLIQGVTDIIAMAKHVFIFQFQTSSASFSEGFSRYNQILRSVRWKRK